MGELCHLTQRERRRRVASGEGPAQILLFTGVRIERGDFRLADRLPAVSGPEKAAANSE
ncbi:MAG TPA: hypothetical protein VHK03_07565 [Aestuariivirgaceae bacterium]|jgi:hypothetical protein|nr:hypothetical protein [Aestuariivirgaceae bacterium]